MTKGAQHRTAADISGDQTLQIDAEYLPSEEVVLARMLPCASATTMVRKRQARQRLIQRRLYGSNIRNISAQRWRYCQSIQRHFTRIQRARDLVFNHSGQQDRGDCSSAMARRNALPVTSHHQDHSDQRGSGAPPAPVCWP